MIADNREMTEVIIRGASPADIPAITRIYADAVAMARHRSKSNRRDEAEMARRHRALLANGYPYLVAELAGTVAGYAYAGPYRARPAYRWRVEDSVYIAPEFHRRGIGGLLLARLVEDSGASAASVR